MANHGGPMRLAWAIIGFFMLVAGPVAAAMPDPPPPDDFAARQYIDGSGCVFLHDDDGWQARRDRDGAQVCGFPPTLSQRGLAPPPGIAERLAVRIAEGPAMEPQPEPEPEPEPHPALRSALEQDLQALIFQQDGMRAAMMGMHDRNLCGLLGYQPAPDGIAVLGQDVTYGRCAGMIATVPGHVVTPGARHRAEPPVADPPGDSTPLEDTDPAEPALAQPAAAEPATAKADVAEFAEAEPVATQPAPPMAQAPPAPARRSAPQAAERVEMIPAHARYIRIGRYPDRAAALPLAHELVSRGYAAGLAPAPDQPEARLLLVGPFGTRAALVRALNELRADGHADAVAY